MFHTLKARLIFCFVCCFLLTEALQLFICYTRINSMYITQKKDTLLQAYDEINDDEFEDVYEDIVDVMQDYEETSNLYFTITDAKKTDKIIYQTSQHDLIYNDFADISLHADDFADDATPTIIDGQNSQKWLVMYSFIHSNKQDYHIMIYTCYEAEFTNTISKVVPLFSISTIISLVVAIIIAIFLSNRIAKPITAISKIAQHITEQNFDDNVPKHLPKDEIGTLGQNISLMSTQLKSDLDQLIQNNKQLEYDIKEKERIDRLRKEFLSNVSHELKTPLSIISSYAEMLRYEGEHIDQNEYLEVILDETQQMNKMIRQLLDVSRLENQLEKIVLKKENISTLLEDLLKTRQVLFTQNQLFLTTSITPNCFAFVEKSSIFKAMDNYITNAIKYSTKETCVSISLFADDNYFHYEVTNVGTTISKQELENIWDSFYKLDKARLSERNLSVGLGLHIVKTVVLAHKGRFYAKQLPDGMLFGFKIPKQFQ